MENYLNYKLCFVNSSEYKGEEMTLYFTELDDVTKQWGDDWDDAPYEHNAGTPYENNYNEEEQGVENGKGIYPKIDIFRVIITTDFNVITPRTGLLNSPYTVEDINNNVTPWITIQREKEHSIFIKAGTTLKEFLDIYKKYCPREKIFVELREENK